jgi:hypothetical protein
LDLAAGMSSINLVIRGGSLFAGVKYDFTLVAGGSRTSIDVTVIGAPRNGLFKIAPSRGRELLDVFALSAWKWLDDELPTTFAFGYHDPKTLHFIVVQSRSELASARTILPAGAEAGVNNITCQVNVYNVLDAMASSTFSVTVTRDVLSAQSLSDLIESSLNNIVGSDKVRVDSTRQIVSAGSRAMNAANCSLAPDCTVLFREACSTVAHTCGICQNGYFATSEYANTRCFPEIESDPTDVTSLFNYSCNSIVPCVTAFHECIDGFCKYPDKRCVSDCSGRGHCEFELIASGRPASTCFVNDILCEGVCKCDEGFVGNGCEESVEDVETRQQSRWQMINMINDTIQYEDKSETNTLSLVPVFVLLAEEPVQLSVEACSALNTMLYFVVSDARQLGVTYEGIIGLFSVINSCQIVFEIANMLSLRDGLASRVDEILAAIASEMVQGQNAVTYIQPGFRVASAVGLASSNITISPPRTLVESLYGSEQSTVTLLVDEFSGNSTDESASMSVVETPSRYIGVDENYTSNALKVVLTRSSGDGAAVEDKASAVVVVLQTYTTHDYFNRTENTTKTTICGNQEVSSTNHTCDSGFVITHNCTGVREMHVTTCPAVLKRPHCKVLGKSSATCKVLGFTPKEVKCKCKMAKKKRKRFIGGLGRRALTLAEAEEETEEVEVIAMTVFVADSFVNTLSHSDDLTLASVRRSLRVIYMFGVLWYVLLSL